MTQPPVNQPAVEQRVLPIAIEGTPPSAPNATEAGRVARKHRFKPYTMDQLFLPTVRQSTVDYRRKDPWHYGQNCRRDSS